MQPRKMFGYPAAFTTSTAQMFACLFGDEMIVRLPESDRATLRGERWKRSSPPALKRWIAKAHAYATSLPPKAKKNG